MNADLAALLYLVSGVLFILALRGLSSPETSRQGNTFGMIGMAIAIGMTLWLVGPDATTWGIIVAAVADRRRRRRDHRALDQDDGDAAARGRVPLARRPRRRRGCGRRVLRAGELRHRATASRPERGIKMQSLIELSLGTAIGAVTFTGSVIAFAKLNGNMSRRADHAAGAPPPQHRHRARHRRADRHDDPGRTAAPNGISGRSPASRW